ncbi:MAG: SOS response-associated peptidase [Opitutaceae bacterium]|nr:SOS response-associated peptidase [Opitutaceae bacterium]
MCVRYTLHNPEAALSSVTRALKFDLAPAEWLQPRYNVALTSRVPVVALEQGKPMLVQARWGFPRFGPGAETGPHANAKSETARTLRTFASSVKTRRCLVPANGFYEWQGREGKKWPFLFQVEGGESFSFAGIWSDASDELQFCFLTTGANPDVSPLHHRMPVILQGDACAVWLQPGQLNDAEWEDLTTPPPAGTLTATALDPFVSSTRNEGPRCHEPLKPAAQLDLFG